jgi:hypothetical protein
VVEVSQDEFGLFLAGREEDVEKMSAFNDGIFQAPLLLFLLPPCISCPKKRKTLLSLPLQ